MKQTTKSNVGFRDRLDPLNDTVTAKPYGGSGVSLSASTLVRTGATTLNGIYVSSTTSGVLKIWDSTTASGTVKIDTFTPAVGWHNFGGLNCSTGLYIQVVSGTIAFTPNYDDPTVQS